MRIFTDGACSSNGKKSARTGCGIYIEDDNREFSHTLDSAKSLCGITGAMKHTNNTGELLAILCALVLAREPERNIGKRELIIYTDSMYSINCLSVWLKNWKKNNWKTAAGNDVKNKTLIQAIDARKSEFKSVIFVYVQAHCPEPLDRSSEEHRLWFGNDIADKLATQAITININ